MQVGWDACGKARVGAALVLACGLGCPVRAQLADVAQVRGLGLASTAQSGSLIVIGFMGGNVGAGNMLHREAAMAKELQEHVKTRYAAHAYPRAIHFVDQLPKTPSGKVKRSELRARRRDELLRTAGTIA